MLALPAAVLAQRAPSDQPVHREGPIFSPWVDPEYPPRTKEAQQVEPFKIFDNVYYVGLQSVGSFLITTSQGLILIDPTYDYTADLILDSVKKLGFNPRDIKYVLVTHGHADHASGNKVVKDATGARFVMAAGDWEMYEDPKAFYPKIPREVVAKTGDSVTLGDTVIRFYVTPGHTPGCLSMEFTVFDNGKPYKALAPGGLGVPNGIENLKLYVQSVATMRGIPDVQVLLPDHPFMSDMWETAQKLQARKAGDAHPFVDSRQHIVEWFDTLENAVRAKMFFDEKQTESKLRR
jgi:metallo-beta-lactamase class B